MPAVDTAPPGRMARRRQVTRDSLMAAGQQLFAVRPIDSVSIDQIVDIADVAKGSFYNHFSDKDALAQAIVEMVGGDCEFHIQSANYGIDDPALRVARAIGVMIRYALNHPERIQSVINLSERKTDASSPLNRGLRFDLVDGLSKRRFQDIDLETGALLVLGMITVTLRHRVESGTPTTAPEAAARVAATVLRGLGLALDEARSLGEAAATLIETGAR
ncbi:TetR/AcrR family transcriptional regulator [Sphingomonas sp. RB3P16]